MVNIGRISSSKGNVKNKGTNDTLERRQRDNSEEISEMIPQPLSIFCHYSHQNVAESVSVAFEKVREINYCNQ